MTGSRRQYNIGSAIMYMIRKATNTGVAGATLSRAVNSDYVLSPVDMLIGILQSEVHKEGQIDIPTRYPETMRLMKIYHTTPTKFVITELREVLRNEFSWLLESSLAGTLLQRQYPLIEPATV